MAHTMESYAYHAESVEPLLEYRDHPREFCQDILGVNPWSSKELAEQYGRPELNAPGTAGQVEILEALQRERRLVCPSCYGGGKTWIESCASIHHVYTRKPAMVIHTAPTMHQLKEVLWEQIIALLQGARRKLKGRLTMTSLKLGPKWLMRGLTGKSKSAKGGLHPVTLFLIEEASGLSHDDMAGFDGIMIQEDVHVGMFGNPLHPHGPLFDACENPVISKLWWMGRIDARLTPNVVAGEKVVPGLVERVFVDEARLVHGEKSEYWIVKVEGRHYLGGSLVIVPNEWVLHSHQKWARHFEGWQELGHVVTAGTYTDDDDQHGKKRKAGPEVRLPIFPREFCRGKRTLCFDASGGGRDDSSLYFSGGGWFKHIENWSIHNSNHQAERILIYAVALNVERITIDATVYGDAVADNLKRLIDVGELDIQLVRVYWNKGCSSEKAKKIYFQFLDEVQFRMRFAFNPENLESVMIDPADAQLAKELPKRSYTTNDKFQIKVQRKSEMDDSPDNADAILTKFAAKELAWA